MPVPLSFADPDPIRQCFIRGGLLAYPTEAVWGLGCNPWDEAAVQRLLTLKQRPVHKGLILVAGDWATMAPLINHLTPAHRATLTATWPGPVTWLIPRPPGIPNWITGHFDTLAVRLSANPAVAELSRIVRAPLVSTSANRAGRRPARHGFQVRSWLGKSVDLVCPGAVGGAAAPSTIRDLATNRIVR